MQATIEQLNEIFRDVLDNPDLNITEDTVAADVEEWDSLNHMHLIVAIEKHYKILLTSRQIHNWKNAGDILKSVNAQLSAEV